MEIGITTFAQLKNYFDAEFKIEVPEKCNVNVVLDLLATTKPDARELLTSSRVAIKEEFVDNNFVIEAGQNMFILPPSSGG